MARAKAAHWEFTRRFRRGGFSWKSQPAIERVRQAVSEIKTVARRDPVLGAEGAVLFLERVSPALISYPRALLVAQRMCERRSRALETYDTTRVTCRV